MLPQMPLRQVECVQQRRLARNKRVKVAKGGLRNARARTLPRPRGVLPTPPLFVKGEGCGEVTLVCLYPSEEGDRPDRMPSVPYLLPECQALLYQGMSEV